MIHSRPAALFAAIAAAALLSALVAAPADSAERLRQSGGVKKGVQMKCPPKFTAACPKHKRLVCVQRDSKGCCTKSACHYVQR
jgi:hypothetical protein